MAQLDVEPKKNSNWWIWLLIIVAILLAWWIFSPGNTDPIDNTVDPITDTIFDPMTDTTSMDNTIPNY